MATIEVTRIDPKTFRVSVREAKSTTVHEVTVTPEQASEYGGEADPVRLVKAAFEFLLEREPKESILSTFELPVIERYFREFPAEIRRRLG
ncbi:MAG: hypothetical protein O7B99_14025 [Planctomycetota bacterium]|nr:hypothetical protein [Planctomycetota bacterium]